MLPTASFVSGSGGAARCPKQQGWGTVSRRYPLSGSGNQETGIGSYFPELRRSEGDEAFEGVQVE